MQDMEFDQFLDPLKFCLDCEYDFFFSLFPQLLV